MFNLCRHLIGRSILLLAIAIIATASRPAQLYDYSVGSEVDTTKEEGMTISLLDQAATMNFEDYNPTYIIQVVNQLQPLGKEKALAQIDSYLENRDPGKDAYGLFWVLRVLFEVPTDPGFPPVRLGQPTLPPPNEPGKLPRFPIVVVQDIPFLVIRGYYLGGFPEPVEAHIAYFRTHGVLREKPLTPPVSMDGIEEEFLQQWKAAYGDAYTAEVLETLKAQIDKIDG